MQNGSELHSSFLPILLQWWEKLLFLIYSMDVVVCKSALLYTKSVSEVCRCNDVGDVVSEKSEVADAPLLSHFPGPDATHLSQCSVNCDHQLAA